MKNLERAACVIGLTAGLSIIGQAAVGGGSGTASAAGSAATSNGTNGATNPSSVGSSLTPPEQLNGVGNGTVSNADTGRTSNQDYESAVRVYGANSAQAHSALEQRSVTRSRAAPQNTGQTYPDNGTFVPSTTAGSGTSGTFTGVGTGAGMATGTGTGTNTGTGSTNGSPTAH